MMTNNFIVANTIIKGEWSSVLNKLSFFECDDYDLKNAITGIALKSESGKVNDLLRSKPVEKPEDYSFTKLYEHKVIKNLVDVFELETTRIRIFKQEPNHETSLHIDYNNTNSSKEDYLTPWLKHVLNFFGIKNIQTISADQMSIDYEGSIKKAEEQISKIT